MSKKYLYYFSEGNDAFGGDKVTMKNTLGGKGAGLAEMTAAGMPVPQGFTITTDACTQYYADGRQINDDITADIFEHLKGLEEITGKKFDLIACVSPVYEDFGIPKVKAVGMLTGLSEDKVVDDCLKILEANA